MKKILIISAIVLSSTFPIYAQSTGSSNTNNPKNNAVPTYTLLEPLPCVPNAKPAVDDPCTRVGAIQDKLNFKYYVQYMFNLLIALAAVASVFMIVYGGLQYMSTDSWQGKNDGLSKARNALLGLVLVLTSFIILRTIDPRLVAIPSTLVPPLNIQYESVNSGIFGQIEQDYTYYRNQTNSIAAQRIQINTELEKVQRELSASESERGALLYEKKISATDPRVVALDQKILQQKNTVLTQKAEAVLKNGQAAIVASIHQYTGSLDLEEEITPAWLPDIQRAREGSTKFYKDAVIALDNLAVESAALNQKFEKEALFINKQKELDATYYPIYGDLLLMENSLLSGTGDIDGQATKALADIQQVEKVIIPKILDLEKKVALQNKYEQIVNLIVDRINRSKNIQNFRNNPRM